MHYIPDMPHHETPTALIVHAIYNANTRYGSVVCEQRLQ